MISGIVLAGFGSSALIFTSIGDYIINPDSVKPNSQGFFPKEIADRVSDFIFTLMIIFSVAGSISCLLIFPYQKEETDAKASLIDEQESESESTTIQVASTPVEESFMKALCSKPFFMLTAMSFCTMFYVYMITNTNRTFASTLSQSLLATMSKVYALTNGGCRILWGSLLDKFGFKPLYITALCLQLVSSASVYFVSEIGALYFIANIMAAVTFAGHTSLMPPTMTKVFGIKNSAELYSLAACVVAVGSILGPVLAKFVVHAKSDYLILYMAGLGFTVISLTLCILFREEPFQYNNVTVNNSDMVYGKAAHAKEINSSDSEYEGRTTAISSDEKYMSS